MKSVVLAAILVQAAASRPYKGTKIEFPISTIINCKMPLIEKYQLALKLKNNAIKGIDATAINDEAVSR